MGQYAKMSETERVIDPTQYLEDVMERGMSLSHGILDRGNHLAKGFSNNAVVRDKYGTPSLGMKKMFQGGSGGGGFLGEVMGMAHNVRDEAVETARMASNKSGGP